MSTAESALESAGSIAKSKVRNVHGVKGISVPHKVHVAVTLIPHLSDDSAGAHALALLSNVLWDRHRVQLGHKQDLQQQVTHTVAHISLSGNYPIM